VASGLSPQDRDALLRALIQGGQSGAADPMVALQNILQAQGGPSAAQAIVAGLRNRLIPSGQSAIGSPSGPATLAARGLSGEEPNYAKIEDRPGGILGEQTPAPKGTSQTDDIAAAAKKFADQTPAPAPAGNGLLGGNITVPPVPDVPAANVAVNRAVAASNVKGRDRDMLVRMTAMEAGGEGQRGQEAVAHVMLNRAALGKYGAGSEKSITGVVTAPGQFEPWNTRRKEMMALTPDSPRYKAAAAAVDRVLSGESPDLTNGATHFLNVGTMQARGGVPDWARNMSNKQVIGNHTFGNADAYKPQQVFQARSSLAGRSDLAAEFGAKTSDEPGPVRSGGILADQPLQAPTAPAPAFGGAGSRRVNALIVHHTGGNEQTPEDVQAVYQQRGLAGAHLFMDRQGNVSQTLGFDQAGQHIRNGQGPGRGLSNANTIGIEVSAKDDSDITPEQKAAMQKLYPQLQQQFPGLKVFGHGEINPHKQATEGSTIVNDLRNMGKLDADKTPAPAAADQTGPTTIDPDKADNPLTINVTPSNTDLSNTDLGPVGPADQGDLGGDGISADCSAALAVATRPARTVRRRCFRNGTSRTRLSQTSPFYPTMTSKPADYWASRIRAGLTWAASSRPREWAARACLDGIRGRTHRASRSDSKSALSDPGWRAQGRHSQYSAAVAAVNDTGRAPLPPPRPADLSPSLPAPQLDMPDVPLPPRRPVGLTTDALPPPRPSGLLAGTPPGSQLGAKPSLPALDPDRMMRDPLAPAWQNPPLGPGMGGQNPPWQDVPKPSAGILGTPNTPGTGSADDIFSRLTKGAGVLSGAFDQASNQLTAAKRPSGSSPSRPMTQDSLLTGGLLSRPRQGIDLNRFFGLLSGRVG
jgi:spore germination cell wall hydrolase CwlJ-like protein